MTQPRDLGPDEQCDCHLGPDLALQERPGPGFSDLAFRSELRAVEQGHRAYIVSVDEGVETTRWRVVSNCRHERSYGLLVMHRPGATLPTSVTCDCESGRYRSSTYPVPCKHAALVLRSAERRGWLSWHEGLWWHEDAWQERVKRLEDIDLDLPEDPFEGLGLPEEDEL